MKTKISERLPLRLASGTIHRYFFIIFSALMLSANVSKACQNKGVDYACYYTQGSDVFLNIGVLPDYWKCVHDLAAAGNQIIQYSVVLYDSQGNVIGTFAAQSSSNPFTVNLGNIGTPPPYTIDIVETVIDLPAGTTDTYPWGIRYAIGKTCDAPDPGSISAICFSNERNSIYSQFNFQVPPSLYAYCAVNNVTPVLYLTSGYTPVAGPVAPAVFNYQSLRYDVFPFLDPNVCYSGGLVFRNNTTGVEDPYAYWLSSINNTTVNKDGLICNCVSCEAGFGVDQHLHDASSMDVSFIPYNPAAIGSQLFEIYDSNGNYYTNDGTVTSRLANGTYTVCHTVVTKTKERCRICKTIVVSADKDPKEEGSRLISGVSLSPNPASDMATVAFNLYADSDTDVQLINGFGRAVKSLMEKTRLLKGEQKISFSASDLEDGLYTIRIATDSEVETISLMIRH